MPRGARTADLPADRRCQDRQYYIALGGRRALAGLGILSELHGLQILGDLLHGLQILGDLLMISGGLRGGRHDGRGTSPGARPQTGTAPRQERIIISVGFNIDKFVMKTSVLLNGGLQSNKKEITK